MTTYYTPYFYHRQPEDFDLGFGGEGDSGNRCPPPEKSKSLQIVEVNGNTVEITPGQRKVGGPPLDYDGLAPGQDCEIFCGKIPRDIFEDELIPLFEQFGTIWDLRLMMNPVSLKSRGYAFIKFVDPKCAKEAVRQMEHFEIRTGKELTVTLCKPKVRLFVGNIPKIKGKDELMAEFARRTEGLSDVIVYNSPDEKKKNRGFCFLEYISHKHAYLAKKKLFTTPIKFWGCDIIVDWADPMEEPDDDIMSKVKVLYVRNLTQIVTQDRLRQLFITFGNVERVKKIKDYAFIHFEDREGANRALKALNGKPVCGTNLEITWAKPPTDKKKRETILRARERRTMQLLTQSPRKSEPPRNTPSVGVINGMRPNMEPSGRGDFNDWGSWGHQQIFQENDFYPYCPYIQPRQSFENQTRSEAWNQLRDCRQNRPQMTWTRGRRTPSVYGMFEGPCPTTVKGPVLARTPDDDDNWRANCGPKPITPQTTCTDKNVLEHAELPTTINSSSSTSNVLLNWRSRP